MTLDVRLTWRSVCRGVLLRDRSGFLSRKPALSRIMSRSNFWTGDAVSRYQNAWNISPWIISLRQKRLEWKILSLWGNTSILVCPVLRDKISWNLRNSWFYHWFSSSKLRGHARTSISSSDLLGHSNSANSCFCVAVVQSYPHLCYFYELRYSGEVFKVIFDESLAGHSLRIWPEWLTNPENMSREPNFVP